MENEVDVTILPRTGDLVFGLLWLVSVIFLLLWDLLKAWKRRAPWIPGQIPVLSTIIIRLLSSIDYSNISVYSGSRYQTEEVKAILVKNHLVIDSGRLMMCVLIAFLLPGMARSGSIMNGCSLAALAFSITFHVVSEFRSDWKVEKQNESLSALAPSSDGLSINSNSTFLIIVFTCLLWLLIQAVMIGRSIRRFISQKIPSAISCCRPSTCDPIKKHALKCWIVVRLCQPDYVLSRLGFCSTVWPATICFGFYFIKRIVIDNELLNSVTKSRTLVQLVIAGQILIVVIGWIVLLVRGVTSDMQGIISGGYYVYGMSMEDALTDLSAYFIRLFVRDTRIQERRIRDMNQKIRDILSLWNPRHWVEKLFQIFSMQYPPHWVEMSAHRFQNAEVDDTEFSVYHGTLNGILIPGESPRKLWKANRWGFRKVQERMHQGETEVYPTELISFLRTRTREDDRVKEDMQRANKNSWKRTAVSLIHFMIYSYNHSDASAIQDASVIGKAMQCYNEGWKYMDFVDGLNEEVESLGRQADAEFDRLEHSWNNPVQTPQTDQSVNRSNGGQLNPMDSTEDANDCLCETSKIIDHYLSAHPYKIDWLQRVLAHVYFFYMTEGLKEAVLQKCSKLAEEDMEEEILDVAFLAAKAQGLLDEVNRVEPRHNTDQASTSSTILQTWHTALRRWLRWLRLLNEEVGEGNGQAEPAPIGSSRHNDIEVVQIVFGGNSHTTQHRQG